MWGSCQDAPHLGAELGMSENSSCWASRWMLAEPCTCARLQQHYPFSNSGSVPHESTAASGDQGVSGIAEQAGRLAGFEDLHADKGAVDQHRELPGKPVGRRNRQTRGDGL